MIIKKFWVFSHFNKILLFLMLSLIAIQEGCKKNNNAEFVVSLKKFSLYQDPNYVSVSTQGIPCPLDKYNDIYSILWADDCNDSYQSETWYGYHRKTSAKVMIFKICVTKKIKDFVEIKLTATELFEIKFEDFPEGKLYDVNENLYYHPPFILKPGQYNLRYLVESE